MADEQQQPTDADQAQQGETPAADAAPVTFETVYGALTPEQQEALDGHIDGLKNALKGERDGRKALERQLRDLAKTAEQGSELRQQLDKLAADQAAATAQATFYEAAHAANVKNLRLAWLAANDAGLVDKAGDVDFDRLKQVAPELFAAKTLPTANAGNGAGQTGARQPSMNDFLRAASGRGR